MKKIKFFISFLFVSLISFASSDIAIFTKSIFEEGKDLTKSQSYMLRGKRNPMPNLFVGGSIRSYMGRHDAIASWSGDAYYNHEFFSVSFSSGFSFNLFPHEEAGHENLSEYYTSFNITQGVGTYFFYKYKDKRTFRAFTGQVAYTPLATLFYYKKQSTNRDNKIGVRLGFMHDQENIYPEMTLDMIKPDNYVITSYSANSMIVGISRSTFSFARYGKNTFFHNGNLYFDLMFNVNSSESYKLPRVWDEDDTYYHDLDLFDYRIGWRLGLDNRSTNSPWSFLNRYQGFEIGMLSVPKYSPVSGLYFLVKFGFMFNAKVY